MKISVVLMWVLCGFFAVASALYVVWGFLFATEGVATVPAGDQGGRIEWVGGTALALCAAMFALIAFYLGRVRSSLDGQVLAEDRGDADIDDGEAEQGFFSPWSWWPVSVAFGAGLVFLGIAAGIWLAIIGVVVAAIALVGWVYEYYRGNFAH